MLLTTNSRLLRFTGALLLTLTVSQSSRALVDAEAPVSPGSDYELVVVELENCIYCGLFRRDVLPAYENSQRARAVPIRFVDLNVLEAGGIGITSPIVNVPTVLVLKSGIEIGRIPGYVGPENFFHSINSLLPELN